MSTTQKFEQAAEGAVETVAEFQSLLQAARDAVPEGAEFEELLSRLEWISLRQICN